MINDETIWQSIDINTCDDQQECLKLVQTLVVSKMCEATRFHNWRQSLIQQLKFISTIQNIYYIPASTSSALTSRAYWKKKKSKIKSFFFFKSRIVNILRNKARKLMIWKIGQKQFINSYIFCSKWTTITSRQSLCNIWHIFCHF